MLSHVLRVVLLFTCTALLTPVHAQDMTLRVDAGRPGMQISPTLYGILFEEMSLAGDDGLCAEMLRNSGFEDGDTPVGWELWGRTQGAGLIEIDTSRPLTANSPRSLRVTVKAPSEGSGASNSEYWGITICKGASYRCSFYAQTEDKSERQVWVSLISSTGDVTACKEVTLNSTGWKKYEVRLTAKADCDDARLVISSSKPGAFWLDMVSLMPVNAVRLGETYIRPDLLHALTALNPKVMRFPGGCFVEGDSIDHAPRWKTTIGPIENRRSHQTTWGYPISSRLGLYEYLLLCEKMGTEPLFDINCGMSCQIRPNPQVVPMEEMGPYVKDALDLIEYCNGGVDTEWGAVRAASGHPEPFNLKYIEIGNENSGRLYEERYVLFHDAIKARYPEIQVLATAPIKARTPDILDEHWYNPSDWFPRNANRFDSYDRKGPKIYVGEYAVLYRVGGNSGGGANLKGALGEAAFMMGMERNSDVVAMATYAPVLGSEKIRVWSGKEAPVHHAAQHPVLLDGKSWFGTPAYYVMKLMGENKGDILLPITVPDLRTHSRDAGSIGLSSCYSDIEFKDIKVSSAGKVIYSSSFTDSASTTGWSPQVGEWSVQDGSYRQKPTDVQSRSVLPLPECRDYTLKLRARRLAGNDGLSVLFKVKDDKTYYRWNIAVWKNTMHTVDEMTSEGNWPVTDTVYGGIETGRWYDIRIEVAGDDVKCYLDDQLIHECDLSSPQFHAVASRNEKSGDIIIKVVNLSERPLTARLNLTGVPNISSRANLTVLTASSGEVQNTMESPKRVYPKKQTIKIAGTSFSHEFPPLSLSILRLGTNRF